MPPTRREYLDQQAAGTVIEQKAAARASQYLRAAALQAEEMTGNAAWDTYRTKLEARRADAQTNAETNKNHLVGTFNEDERNKRQCNYYYWCGRIEAFKEAIALPLELLQAYKDGQGASPAPPQAEQEPGVTATDAA